MAAPRSKRPAPAREPRLTAIATIFVAAALLAYLPALGAQYIWDDESYVTGNETLRTWGGLPQIWLEPWATPQYYPLVHTTFWLEYRLWGLAPGGYHAVNILLHAASGVLVFVLLRRLKLPGAPLAAALFTLHPVHVESVAWITERKNVLSALLYLSAMLAYLRFRPLGGEPGGGDRKDYFLALALFAGALLSKTVTASMPAAALLLVYWKDGRVTRRDVLLLLPFFALGIAAGGNTAWLEKHRVGAYGQDWALSFADRLLIAGRAVWFYLGKLVWPHPLIFIYPRWELDPRSLLQWAFPITALLAIVTLVLQRHRLGRGPLVAALFFGGTLFPALGFFDVYPMRFSFVADHFQYLASLGPLALMSALAVRIFDRPERRTIGQGAAALLLLALGTLTHARAVPYHDYETLWLDTLAKNPRCAMAHNNLGLLYEKTGRVPQAIAQYQLALEVKPAADAHTNLGNVLLAAGRRQEAMTHLREAVRLAPDSSEAWNNLGGGLTEAGETKEALDCYRRATAIDPADARLHLNLGSALTTSGDLDRARTELQAAVPRLPASHRPAMAAAFFNLGNALFQRGRVPEAAEQYRHALQARPDDVDSRINLGYALVRMGRGPEARPLFEEALARDPASKRARAGLAMVGAAPPGN